MTGEEHQTVSRRKVLTLSGAAAGLAATAAGGTWAYRTRRAELPLHAQTVAYASDQRRELVTDPDALEAGSRVVEGPGTDAARRRMQVFLRTAQPWLNRVPSEHRDLAHGALLDLWVLSDRLPATVAGWSPRWRYIWPRDAAFCAAALARVGHDRTAVTQLRHLQQLQTSDGWFEARYVPGTGKPPDGRDRQFDGTGLVAWAVADVRASATRAGRPLGDRLDPMVSRSYRALVRATDHGRTLPAPSPDFWEVAEDQCTIAIAACTLGGLVAAGRLLDEPAAGERFRRVVRAAYADHDFQRYGSRGGPDAGVAFLDATGVHGLSDSAALTTTLRALRQPAGGITPGESWKNDGISWTPATSLLGLALARAGAEKPAAQILRWLAAHRTALGSIPEKVLHDGAPAAEAPLSWSAANAVLTLDTLMRR